MPYDDDLNMSAWEVLFGEFDWLKGNLKNRYFKYTKNMKPKIKDYIFGNYILSSKSEER